MAEEKIKYIYWFAYFNLDSPTVRYRAKYPLDFARENLEIESRIVVPGYSPRKLFTFVRAYLSALIFPKKNSLVVIQKVRSNFIYSNLLKLLVKFRKEKTLYDIDDADYNPKSIHFFAKNCKFISVGSEEILVYLTQFNPNTFLLTSPTPDFGIVKQERSEIFTIGWVGDYGGEHKVSLSEYELPAIKNLPFRCKLSLLGIRKPEDEAEIREYFKNQNHVQLDLPKNIDWKNEKELQNRIKLFDVGVATLVNQPIQLAKSGIKAKQYLNNGVPVLCNDLPENNKIIESGYNGFLCDTSREFNEKMILLKEMTPEEYQVFSKNARKSTCNFDHHKYFECLNKNGVIC